MKNDKISQMVALVTPNKLSAVIICVVAFLLTRIPASGAQNQEPVNRIVITGDMPWIITKDQPEPIQRALEDVKADWYKVFGHTPIVLEKRPAQWNGIVIYMGVNGMLPDSMPKATFPGSESFMLRVQHGNEGRTDIVAMGSDMRGTIYAVYALSEEILGVDPWYYWTDHEPARKDSIIISAELNKQSGTPTFKYRGWFINDEDLLSKFSPDPLKENVFSLQMFDHIYETLLRLHGNMIAPATYPFPDERCQELAARRGLILNMHHILVLGLNTFKWPQNVPFSFTEHPGVMEAYWKKCIDAYKDYEVIWTVGYRGKRDRPFWLYENGAKTPEDRGRVISNAIAKEVEMVREVRPDAPFIANMWAEGQKLYHQGFIKLPEGVTLVWPDNGAGRILDKDRVRSGQGVYYHTAMYNHRSNQLTEMVNPGRIYAQAGRFVQAGATEFFLVNVSDIRQVPLSTDCVMKMIWNAKPYLNRSEDQNMTAFLRDWSRRQFGSPVAGEVSKIYTRYFNIAYMGNNIFQGENSLITRNLNLHQLTDSLIERGKPVSDTSLNLCREYIKFCETNLPYVSGLFFKADSLKSQIPEARRAFYQSHVLTQIQIHRQLLTILENYSRSILAYHSHHTSEAISYAERSLKAGNELYSALHKAEYGKWAGWFMGDRLADLNSSYDSVRKLLAELSGKPVPPVRPVRLIDTYEDIYHYQDRFSKNYPLLYDRD